MRSQKGFAHILFLPILLIGIVVTVYLALNPTFFTPKATDEEIRVFTQGDTALPKDSAGVEVTTSRTIKIQLSAPAEPYPSPQGFKLVKEAFASHTTCPTGTTHVGPTTYSCGYSSSEVAPGQCPNGGAFQRSACSDGSNVHYTDCVCNAVATATPTSAPTGNTTTGGPRICNRALDCGPWAPDPTKTCGTRQCIYKQYEGPEVVGLTTDCQQQDEAIIRVNQLCAVASATPSPTPTAAPVTAVSFIMTDSPVNPQDPQASDPNAVGGVLNSGGGAVANYTITRTEPGEAFIFVKFVYSNGQSQVISKRLKYDPNFGASPSPSASVSPSPSPSPSASGQQTPTPEPTSTPQASSTPSPTPLPTSTPLPTPIATPEPALIQNTTQFPTTPFSTDLFTSDAAQEDNLLRNGDFEEELTGSDVAAWGTQCVPSGSRGSCERDSSQKKNGVYSLKVSYNGGGFGNQLEWPAIDAQAGEELCLSYWVKRGNLFTALFDKPVAAIQSNGADEDSFFEPLFPSSITTDWQFVQGTIKVGNDWVTPIKVFLRSQFRFGDTNWFDSVSLKRGAC